MRVRINFTLELDPDEYRDVFEDDSDNEQIREDLQSRAESDVMLRLSDEGMKSHRLIRTNRVRR